MRICGLDEVGRGALAGPLVACGMVWPDSKSRRQISKLLFKDSKKLSKQQRQKISMEIRNSGAQVKIEIISARHINNRGMGWANKEIFRRLVRKIEADKYLVDGNLKITVRGKTDKIKSVVNADATRKCVMAAAIIAKVARDQIMLQLHGQYPRYGWDKNSGYGTQKHIKAIRESGVVRYHRNVYVQTALRNAAEKQIFHSPGRDFFSGDRRDV